MSSQCNPALSFFAHLLLLGGQFAPLVAQHPGDLGEGHVRTLGPELLPPVIHKSNVASEGGFGCIAVLHWLLPLPPFGPAATSGFLRKNRQNRNTLKAQWVNTWWYLWAGRLKDVWLLPHLHFSGCCFQQWLLGSQFAHPWLLQFNRRPRGKGWMMRRLKKCYTHFGECKGSK